MYHLPDQKMMVESGLQIFISKFFHAEKKVIFVTEFCEKMFPFMKEVRENDFAHRGISK